MNDGKVSTIATNASEQDTTARQAQPGTSATAQRPAQQPTRGGSFVRQPGGRLAPNPAEPAPPKDKEPGHHFGKPQGK
ncbi:MAG TPA: hypothetical protein VLK85_20015 [Ramlibacter sp.]|nr:hypothetical protein [Ramlibacter sp.]